MVSCVTGPSPSQSQQMNFFMSSETPKTSGRSLSPILSPLSSPKPLLKVDTASLSIDLELPPRVPPKSPTTERKGSPAPLILSSKASKTQLMTPASLTSGGNTPLSAVDARRSPHTMALPTPPSAFTNPFSAASPASSRGSPRVERRDPIVTQSTTHNRNISESSVMERGRPSRRNSRRQRSRTLSETNNAEAATPDPWQLPQGMRVSEASRRMSDADKSLLHKQAYDQANNFEVLNRRDVSSLSRVRTATAAFFEDIR
jgi:hypothetical protein